MKPLFVFNDWHIGVIRTGGTTPATAMKLRQKLLLGAQNLLRNADDCDVLVNGDLFDTANIPLSDLFSALTIFGGWLKRNPGCTLWLPPGNHDLSKNSEVYSSFDFFSQALFNQFPGQVFVPRVGTRMQHDRWVIPHMANQDLFDIELARVPDDVDYVFLHCNYDNGFAARADHSLNLSAEQARKLPGMLVIAHEHQAKRALDGKVIITGNQMPSSVADCMGNDAKFAMRIESAGLGMVAVWEAAASFDRIDWQELSDYAGIADFIRVEGKATAGQAGEVVATIAKFRQHNPALVITNAVQIEGTDDAGEMEVSLEQIKNFSVLDELLKTLGEDERAKVLRLLEKNNV